MTEKCVLELDASNILEIYLHGATITSWICNSQQVLFLSKKSVFDNKKAIRGGIPIVFPNFGPWEKGPQHGFARIKKWKIKEPINKTDDSVSVELCLTDDEETRNIWQHKFELVLHVVLGNNFLKTYLTISNLGNDQFDFTCLLHTYFLVKDINQVTVDSLFDADYLDKVKDGKREKEQRELITINEETDRVYESTANNHVLDTGHSLVKIEKHNFPETVVWNPWIKKSKEMSDFDDEEYKTMICIEPGYLKNRYILKPNEKVTMGQTLFV